MIRLLQLNLLQLTLSLALPIRTLHKHVDNANGEPVNPIGSSMFYINLIVSISLVLSGGLFAG